MRMKTLACCRRRPQDFSIDMDQEPDSKQTSPSLPTQDLPSFFIAFFLHRFRCVWPDFGLFLSVLQSWISCTGCVCTCSVPDRCLPFFRIALLMCCEFVRGWAILGSSKLLFTAFLFAKFYSQNGTQEDEKRSI